MHNSYNLINTENAVPTKPENNAYIKYNTPMSLALDDKNHLSNHRLIEECSMGFKFLCCLFSNKIFMLSNCVRYLIDVIFIIEIRYIVNYTRIETIFIHEKLV